MSFNRLLQIGEIVYGSYSSQQVGKVIETFPVMFPDYVPVESRTAGTVKRFHQQVRVRWLKKGNPEEVVAARSLKLLEDLIEDHTRKLAGHEARLRKAQAL